MYHVYRKQNVLTVIDHLDHRILRAKLLTEHRDAWEWPTTWRWIITDEHGTELCRTTFATDYHAWARHMSQAMASLWKPRRELPSHLTERYRIEMSIAEEKHMALAAKNAFIAVLHDTLPADRLALANKMFASTGNNQDIVAFHPELDDYPQARRDLEQFHACRWIAALLKPDNTTTGLLEKLSGDWRGALSPDGRSYGALNRTLAHWPYAVRRSAGWGLKHHKLQRTYSNRLELLFTLAAFAAADAHISWKGELDPAKEAQLHILEHATSEEINKMWQAMGHTNPLRKWLDIYGMVSYLTDCPETPPKNAQPITLVRMSRDWHERIANDERPYASASARRPNKPLAVPPIPLPEEQGIEFMTDSDRLYEESRAMHHCVSSYAEKAAAGHIYLFHVEHGGKKATVEVSATTRQVLQSRGPCNEENKATDWATKHLSAWATLLPKPTEEPPYGPQEPQPEYVLAEQQAEAWLPGEPANYLDQPEPQAETPAPPEPEPEGTPVTFEQLDSTKPLIVTPRHQARHTKRIEAAPNRSWKGKSNYDHCMADARRVLRYDDDDIEYFPATNQQDEDVPF